MAETTDTTRTDLLNRSIGIFTLAQLLPVRKDIQEWLGTHPDDEAMKQLADNLERMYRHFDDRTPDTIDYNTSTPGALIRS